MDGGLERRSNQNERINGGDQQGALNKLTYRSLDNGLAVFNEDETPHVFSSAQEEEEVQHAIARHMITGQQTPGMPEFALGAPTDTPQSPTPETVPTISEAPTVPSQTPPAAPPERAQTGPGTGDGDDEMRAHESIEAHQDDDTDARDILHDFQRGVRGGNQAPQNLDQQQVQPPEPPTLDQTQPPPASPQQPQNPEQRSGPAIPNPDELERLLSRLAQSHQPRRNQPEQAELGRRVLDPHLIIGDNVAGRAWRGTDSYEIDPVRYVGINIKKIRTEILTNPEYAQLYGVCLKAINPNKDDVLGRYEGGNPTKEDLDFLSYGAAEFSRSLKIAEDANALWKDGDTELLSRRNRDMSNLLIHEGEPRATELVKSTTLHMAMRDPDAVEDMRDALKQLKEDRDTSRYKRADEKITALTNRLKIEKKDYGVVFDQKNQAESERLIAVRVHEQAGKARKAIDWLGQVTKTTLPGSSRYAAILAMQEASRIMPAERSALSPTSWVMSRIDENLEALASYLGPTVGDPEMRSLISQETLENQNKILAREGGPKNFSETKTQVLEREKSIQSRVKKLVDEPQWASRSQAEQNASLSSLRSEMQREEQRKGWAGFFAWLFSTAFGSDFNKAATQAAGRPVNI